MHPLTMLSKTITRTSPLVQWVRTSLGMQGMCALSLIKELRSHMPGATEPMHFGALHASQGKSMTQLRPEGAK